MSDTEFSVYWFDPDGHYHVERSFVDAETAVRLAFSLIERPATKLGMIRRVIITDGGDSTNFEWKHGIGVTYPQPGGSA